MVSVYIGIRNTTVPTTTKTFDIIVFFSIIFIRYYNKSYKSFKIVEKFIFS